MVFSEDLLKYKQYSNKSSFILLLTQQGLWAIFVYRMNNKIYKSKLPGLFKKILLFFGVIFQKVVEILTGIVIPYTAKIGKRFYIGHFGNIIINSNVEIGENCNISQGVTIGVSGTGDNRGTPAIGNNVYIGANAVLAGKIRIGDNSVIAANSLVIQSFEPNSKIMGVPARRIGDIKSNSYI
jgi:serine O-acetyltransferase